jgi:sterol 3beta-glucosyltransferase
VRITILTYGSRGDVEPFVVLGRGFREAGHEVRLVAPALMADLVRAQGLEHVPLPGEPDRLTADLVGKAGVAPLPMVAIISRHVLALAKEVYDIARQACLGADVILHSFLLTTTGHEFAGQLGIPDVSLQLFPVFSTTAAFPGATFPDLPLGGVYRRLSHVVTTQVFWQGGRVLYGWVRRSYPDLPPLSGWPFTGRPGHDTPILYGFSPHVIPKPPDWGENRHLTGYWLPRGFREEDVEAGLRTFVEGGPPPVYVGFGSMVSRKAQGLADVALEALALAGQRGVLAAGWGGLEPECLPDYAYRVEAAPHAWLFPRMAAVVHHGGAGTTGAGLRAGVPNIVVPFTADQPFWGRRVHFLGVGPRPIPAPKLTAQRLAQAISEAVRNEEMRDRARVLGEQIRSEDGVGRAVDFVERYASRTARSRG